MTFLHASAGLLCATLTASAAAPLEAPDLYLPQSSFFRKPYWGYATVGASLRDGKTTVPLAGITNLQLIATFVGGDGSGNYAVWGAPRLLKGRVSHQERVE